MVEPVPSPKKRTKTTTPRPRARVEKVPEKPSEVSRHFGLALRRLREAKGIRLIDLAAHLDVSLPYLSDVERGRREPLSHDRIFRAAKHLDGDPHVLIEASIRDRGSIMLPVSDRDDLRVKAAMMLVVAYPKATDEVVRKIISMLKATAA